MQLEELLWADWLGIALAAYGLTAGAVRGLTQQFSRLLVWALSLMAASSLGIALAGVQESAEGESVLVVWVQVAVYLAVGALAGWLQRRVFRSTGAKSVADMGLGAASGLLLAAMTWMVILASYSTLAEDREAVHLAESQPVLTTLEAYLSYLPGAEQTAWLSFPVAED